MSTLKTLAEIYRAEGLRQALRSAGYFFNPLRPKGRCILIVWVR